MDELIEKYQDLKLSAFQKVARINNSIHNVTIGPKSTFNGDFEEESRYNEKEERKSVKSKICIPPPVQTRQADLRIILRLKEMQRLEKMQEAISNHRRIMVEEQQLLEIRMRERLWQSQREILLNVERQENQILREEEELDKNLHIQHEQRQRYYQELEERRRKRDQEILAKEQMKKNLEYMNKITKNQQEIGLLYQDIINILKSNVMDEEVKKPLSEVSQKLKVLYLAVEDITVTCKTSVSNVEVQKSTDLLEQMMMLKNQVQQIIDDNNKQKEIKLKQEQINVPKVIAKPINIVTVTETVRDAPKIDTAAKIDKFVSKSSFRICTELQAFLQNHQKSYAGLLADESMKQFKFDCKKAVNIPVNAISAVSPQHLLDKYVKLSNLLSGQAVLVGDSRMSATRHPQGVAFCKDLLAKKFILQGDLMISSNPEAAFCYATVILSLWNDFPDFGKLLLAHFQEQCPYLVPIHLPRSVEQSDEDYYKSLGYQYSDGIVEKQDKFLKRMTGIMRLYSALLISKSKKSQKGIHPHGLSQGWRWLTATLNLEPKTDISATLIHVFLETVGSTMQAVYKSEFRKVIMFLIKAYLPMLKKVDTGGPYTRLEVLLQQYEKVGQFVEPSGILPSTYW